MSKYVLLEVGLFDDAGKELCYPRYKRREFAISDAGPATKRIRYTNLPAVNNLGIRVFWAGLVLGESLWGRRIERGDSITFDIGATAA